MITAAIYSVPVSPPDPTPLSEITTIAAEIAERLCEMEDLKATSSRKLIDGLSRLADLDFEAYLISISLMHGDSSILLDSYAVQAGNDGRKKQTLHYRRIHALERAAIVFPELTQILQQYRLSAMRHNDPLSTADVLRQGMEDADEHKTI